jgi:nitrite transporter NirC
MFLDTVDHFAKTGAAKAAYLHRSPLGFLISAMMAGIYVGMGIILIFSIGGTIDPAVRPVVMGASFGIALTLVIFAGSDLFTGHTMFMTLGWLRRTSGAGDLVKCWVACWIGNLIGSALLAWLFVATGFVTGPKAQLFDAVATAKMTAPATMLIARGILCNWLVCLAIWTSARMTSDTAKCIAIFWCLYAFIACGFEHSVANMTLLSVALFAPHPATVTVSGMAWNLLWVTIGNIISGAVFMGVGYWAASRTPAQAAAPAGFAAAE